MLGWRVQVYVRGRGVDVSGRGVDIDLSREPHRARCCRIFLMIVCFLMIHERQVMALGEELQEEVLRLSELCSVHATELSAQVFLFSFFFIYVCL